ncbi:hypothetical protein P5V15_015871 [Pogonomyrmex californicus]
MVMRACIAISSSRDKESGRRSLTTTKSKRRHLTAASPLVSYALTAARSRGRLWRNGHRDRCFHCARAATATAVATARTTATPKMFLLGHDVRNRMIGLLMEGFQAHLGLVFPPSDGVVPGERSQAMRHPVIPGYH